MEAHWRTRRMLRRTRERLTSHRRTYQCWHTGEEGGCCGGPWWGPTNDDTLEDTEDVAEDRGVADYICKWGPTNCGTLEDKENAAEDHDEADYIGGPTNNDTLEDKKDAAEDHVEADYAGWLVHAVVAAFCTRQALEGREVVVVSPVGTLKNVH